MSYSRVFGSQFPNSVLELSEYKDIGEATDEVKELIKQFYTFMDAGNIASAAALLETNYNTLKQYYFDMSCVNKLQEEVFNTGLYALKQNATIVASDEPDASDYVNATAWLKPLN